MCVYLTFSYFLGQLIIIIICYIFQVIYALNTKKDDHDAQVQHLQEQHMQELDRLAASTKHKLLVYEQRLAEAESHVERIAELEQAVLGHQTQQQEILQQHTDYKHSMQEKLHQQEINFSQKIWEFSGELLETKKDFQEQLQNFECKKVCTFPSTIFLVFSLSLEKKKNCLLNVNHLLLVAYWSFQY